VEPFEVVGFAGVAAAGWALGRASRRREDGGPGPGDAIADAGARLSRTAAFGAAAVGSRVLTVSAAGAALAGSLAARGVGIGADMALGAGELLTGAARRAIPGRTRSTPARPRDRELDLTLEETDSGLVLPTDVNTTI
jgi:hypothetical protein